MKYASNNIRNILIAGHAGSGKTTLTEALVYFSGAAERMGRVEDGTTISDFDPEEAKRKASLSASVVPVEYEGIKYNLIDAPGLFDFEAGEYEGIRAAESVLVCVSGRSGVTVGAEKAFQLARKNGKATMVFISKCDLENANYFKILEEMKIKFGSTVCPCVVPAKLDDGTPVYINLFSQKAFKYESGKQIQVELPDIGHRFQGLIEAMSEAIAETDDELMEKFFGGEPFTTEEIVEGMRKGVKDGLITPVFCGSAVNMQALDMQLYLDRLSIEADVSRRLMRLPQLFGDAAVLDEAEQLTQSPKCLRAIAHLRQVLSILQDYGCADCVSIDLGLTQQANYYSGVVFHGLAAELGQPLLSGGRYDGLPAQFGRPMPATGFALSLKLTLMALERQGETFAPPVPDVILSFAPGGLRSAIAYAHQLRDKGVSVALLYGLTAEELHQRVDSGEASAAVYLNGSVFEQYGKAVF